MPISPTREDLARMFPRALPEWMDALERLAPQLCGFYRFERLDWIGWCGQIGWECNGFTLREMREDMRFTTTKRILEVYSYRLGVALKKDAGLRRTYGSKTALAAALRNQPEFLADVVYGGREGTPWMRGSLYIGRGPSQITHLDNYRAIMVEIRRQPGGGGCPDLVDNPDVLARDPEMGIRSAFADWHIKGLSRWARAQNWDAVGAALNTGSPHKIEIANGLPGRRRWTAKALGIWPEQQLPSPALNNAPQAGELVLREGMGIADGEAVKKAIEELQNGLRDKGYALGGVDGEFGVLTRRAVTAFQSEHGIPVDGEMDGHDMDVLRATAPADLGARSTTTDVPGSQQIAVGRKIERAGEMSVTAGGLELSGQVVFGVSPFQMVMDVLGQAGDALGRITALGLKVDPRVAVAVVLIIGGPLMWSYGRKTRVGRLIAHRLGLNLSR